MKILSTLPLLFVTLMSFSQCDVSIEITSVGEFNYPNFDYLDSYCEDNYTGTNYLDIIVEICATDTSCEPVSVWSGIGAPNVGAVSSWSQFPCRSIMRTNIGQPTHTGSIQIVSCISNWSWTDYSPFIDDDMSNNCDTTYIDVVYCEDGCEGDVCGDPIQLEMGQYGWYDNTQCIDEFGNEILEDDACEISVENDMYFSFSTLSDSICLFVETIDTTNLDLALQIQIWEVENSDYCSSLIGSPLYDACDYGSNTYSLAEFITLTDSINIGVGQFIMLIDGLNGDETEFYLGIDQCSEPLILSNIELYIHGNDIPYFEVITDEDYSIMRSTDVYEWVDIGRVDFDETIEEGVVYYYQAKTPTSYSHIRVYKSLLEREKLSFIFCNGVKYFIDLEGKCYNEINQEIVCPCNQTH